MFAKRRFVALLLVATVTGSAVSQAAAEGEPGSETGLAPILKGIQQPPLRQLAVEVLERNPDIAAAAARALAARHRAPRLRALPDPTASLTTFLDSPETRTGPQQIAVVLAQAVPWAGKLALKERTALLEAAALDAEVEALRLELLTETRRLFYELLYLDRRRVIGEELRDHLSQHEEIARARYATGAGRGQGVVKLQAEITLAENDLLEIRRRRIGLEARLNTLRDRPALTPILAEGMPTIPEISLNLEPLLEKAQHLRPELHAAEARIRNARTRVELAEKSRRPDFSLGLTYTVVDPRSDAAGRLQPPEGNGDDIVGIRGGITLPVRRRSLTAEVEEAVGHETAAEEGLRATRAEIVAAIGDLAQRLELDWRQLRLIDDLLVVQAEEAEESALAGYIAGTLDALALLDAEHVRFEAHTALARAQADYLIGIAELEGAIGAPLESRVKVPSHDA
ncbi:MAG: TolC family protein [bacterium]|nr:TolC family protein [bacterium]